MSQSRSKRKKSGAKRSARLKAAESLQSKSGVSQPSAANTTTATTQPSAKPVKHNIGYYTDRPKDSPSRPPIEQTGSWTLAWLSVRVWIANWRTCLFVSVVPLLTFGIGSVVTGNLKSVHATTVLGIVIMVLSFMWIIVNVPPLYYLQTAIAHGRQPGIRECYRGGYRRLWPLMVLSVLVSGAVLGGLLLFVVPGIIFLRRYALAVYYLYDTFDGEQLSVREAMERSAADSKPVALSVWGVFAVYIAADIILLVLLSSFAKPYGQVLASSLASVFAFAPVLRYREIKLRLPASELFPEED